MRITSSMYYQNVYGINDSKLNNELFDVNKQIASGLKIEYASDNPTTFAKTMLLDNEVTTLSQIKKSTQSGQKFSNQSDQVLNEFTTSMNRMRTLLINAANGAHSSTSLDAIAAELRGIQKNLKSLANTSVNGEYLFAGSAVNTKPISDDYKYQGNAEKISAFAGSNNVLQYNVSGADLFLGQEPNVKREIASNVHSNNLFDNTALSPDNTLRDMMGDKDNNPLTVNTDYFYLRGTKNDGTTIKEKISFGDNEKISTLLDKIGQAYGNTGNVNIVDVTMNPSGEIVIKDKLSGSSKIDFHLVGAVDFSGGNAANVNNIESLNNGETTYPPTNNLFVKEFVKSGFTPVVQPNPINTDSIYYDKTMFSKNGLTLSSNIPQVLKSDNSFAAPATKISDVADLSKGTAGTLDGTSFVFKGTDVNGNSFNATVDFKSTSNGGSTFSVGGSTYNIYNASSPRTAVDADKMSYQQLMDVMNMVTTNSLPVNNSSTAYDTAVQNSQQSGTTSLSYDGKIQFNDLSSSNVTSGTKANISLYDSNAGDFTKNASVMTFNANDAVTIVDPKTDFFKSIDEMITAVENHKLYPNAKDGALRNIGMEYSIARMDTLQDHVFRIQSQVGAQSNTLDTSIQRTSLLEISTKTLRASVIDTDIAEASLKLQQLTLNYQAMLSTVGKVSKLSLVNYL